MDPMLNEVMIWLKLEENTNLYYTDFLLTPFQEVYTKTSPYSGQ